VRAFAVTSPNLTPEVSAEAAEMLAKLHDLGYRDVPEHGSLRPGVRIRHVGVLAVTEKPNSSWSVSWRMPDVELIALWDRPNTRGWLSGLAQYHVEVIGGAA
jgi:hypothetical protein